MSNAFPYRSADNVHLDGLDQHPAGACGLPLILLHGAASNASRWWHFRRHSRLRHRHRMLCPDLRGHGRSLWRGPADVQHWCADLLQLMDRERLPQAVFIGHCLGANLAVHWAARYPQRCAGLVLIEPMPASALRGSLAHLARWQGLLAPLIALARGANRLGLRRRIRPLDLQALDTAAAGQSTAAMRRRYGAPCKDLRVLPSAQYFGNFRALLRPLPLAAIRCPTLAILPRGRAMADPDRTRSALAVMAEVQIRALDADHWLPTRQADALCALIDDWIGAHFPDPTA